MIEEETVSSLLPQYNNIQLKEDTYKANTDDLLITKNIKSDMIIRRMICKKIIGYVILLLVVITNVISSIMLKFIETKVKTFITTYINYSFLTLLILVSFIKNKISEMIKSKVVENEQDIDILLDKTGSDTFSDTYEKHLLDNKLKYNKDFHFMCIILMIFWYLGCAFYNLGLTLTSISTTNTISNVSVVFILVEQVLIFKKKCSSYKIIGLILCTGGVITMSYFDCSIEKEKKSYKLWGGACLTIGALFYSFYAMFVKYYSKKHKYHFDMVEVFGYIGFYNMILIPFPLVILHLFRIETLELPSLINVFYIFLNALIEGFIADLALSYCLVILASHIVSFALIFTGPLSLFYDYLQGNIKLHFYYLLGSSLIITSICIILFESFLKIKKKKEQIRKIILEQKEKDKF